jgi:hypothetical protein
LKKNLKKNLKKYRSQPVLISKTHGHEHRTNVMKANPKK